MTRRRGFVLLTLRHGLLAGRRGDPAAGAGQDGTPLLVALHGGSYSSSYFDVPGFSLVDRAVAANCSIVAFDRPGYRSSTPLDDTDDLLAANAETVDEAIARIWQREQDDGGPGVVLVGHSVGAAIALLLAARYPSWPLLGVAVSGVAMTLPPAGPGYEEPVVPDERVFRVPDEIMAATMFGPAHGHRADAPARAAAANGPVVYREIEEINSRWPERAAAVYAAIRVPVHLRLGDSDILWGDGDAQVRQVRAALSGAPFVDAELVADSGHAIDFHHAGQQLHDDQLAFALECSKRRH